MPGSRLLTLFRAACGVIVLLAAAPHQAVAQSVPRASRSPASSVQTVERAENPGAAAVAAAAGTPARGLRDRAELEAFLDGVLEPAMRDKHIAGATVSVVKDGALFFAKGYGYTDVAKRTPVDPARTLFRIGSTSKLFTWTAVMQQVEQGKLDLDADVNRYLDFKIPATYPQPITLRHIMTHTAGFEEDARDLIGDDPRDMQPLGKWVATHMPERVRPPGTYSSYSNYAVAMAGYIVQRVSGESWEAYIERHILQPLEMQHTTGRQPLPAALRADMSQGYKYAGGEYEPKKFEVIIGAAPAGSMASTATDMAKFMIAHLANGAAPNGRRILAEPTALKMHARAFTHDPRIPGFALGFYEQSSHGLRIIGHGGDTEFFHTDLAIIPAENVGVFVSFNTDTGGELSFTPFLAAFLEHYYPTPATAPPPPPDADKDAQRIAGEYQFNRRSYTTFQKAADLAGATRVAAAKNGALVLRSALGEMKLVPVGPLLYREELGDELVAFKADGAGHITHGFLGIAPMMALERVPWYEAPRLHWVLLGLGAVVFFGTIVAAVGRVLRRRFGEPRPGDLLPGRSLLVGLAVANLIFLAAFAALASDPLRMANGPATELKVALGLPVLAFVLALGAVGVSVLHWRRHAATRLVRLRYSGIVAVALLFTWSLSQFNLLWWRM